MVGSDRQRQLAASFSPAAGSEGLGKADSMALEPCAGNGYVERHARLLLASFRRWTGRDLVAPDLPPRAQARALFNAPFAVLSHDTATDPMLNYANRTALLLFELDWSELTVMPSRLTAEAPERTERARLLADVSRRGYIDDYRGVRVSKTGRRFSIQRATVWNLLDESGGVCGQAATFSHWRFLEAAT